MDDAWWGPSIPLPGGPYFCLAERSLPGCVLVNGAGQRFVNESAPYVDAVHAMYDADTPENPHIPAWLIFDQRYRDRYVFAGLPPRRPLPRRWYAAGAVVRADDLAELAAGGRGGRRRPGQDRGPVQRVRRGGPGRGLRPRRLGVRPLLRRPAAGPTRTWPRWPARRSTRSRSCPGDLGTKGGLRTDERARVLRRDGTVIEGLYAAGNASAAVMGRSYAGAGATIGPAMTFGYIAARTMAAAADSGSEHPSAPYGPSGLYSRPHWWNDPGRARSCGHVRSEGSGMTNTSRGGAPKHDGNCSRNGVLPGRRAGFSRGVAVLAVAACLALAACSSSQGVSGQTPARSAQTGSRITVDMVTHGQAFDPFWALVQKGAQAAAKDFNVNLVYHSPSTTDPQAEASLINQAAARHPKGLVVTIPDAAALSGPVKQATSAGIPVIVMNVGVSVYQNVGALTFVGQDEDAAGQEAGRQMIAAGVHKALCVIHEEQNTALVDRCAGFAKAMAATGGSVTVLHVNGAQLNSAANAIQAALKKDPAITGVLTTGIIGFNAAGGALQSLGKFGTIKLGTFDVSTQDLNAVVNGQALFVIDQQPFLEGYMAVQLSAFEARYGQHPFGPVFTGPSLITKANAAQVQQLYKSTGIPLFNGGYPT